MFSATVFCLLSSGSLFFSAFFKKHFEEVLPITCMGISAVLFIFGVMGILNAGFWFVLITLAVLAAVSLLFVFIRKSFSSFLKDFFTPAFFVFAFLFLVICVCNKEKLAIHSDEFSHWVDSVKAMFLLDDFVTNENSYSQFKSYPPAMALLQYFFQKVNYIINGGGFAEEKVYVAYQVFVVSLILPFFKNLNAKKFFKYLISCLAIICAPLLFYPDILSVVVIDPFVSVLAGCAFAVLLLYGKLDGMQSTYISMICFTLVLAKDIGLYFACFIGICYIIMRLSAKDAKGTSGLKRPKEYIVSLLPVFAALVAKLLWKMEIVLSKTPVFGSNTEFFKYTQMFFLKNDKTYRQEVVEKLKSAFFENRVYLGDFDFKVSYFILTVIILSSLFLFCFLYSAGIKSKTEKTALNLTAAVIGLQFILYIYSLGAIYIANFSGYEAQNLASYQRYMDIVFRAMYIMLVICFIHYFNNADNRIPAFAVFVSIVIILTPFSNVKNFINKDGVRESLTVRERYCEIIDRVNDNCKEHSKIYFISQEDKGYDYQVIRFSLRPHIIDNPFAWSLSEDKPFYEGDIWTKKMSAADFKELLFAQNYDYVAIYKTNDYFSSNYASLFEKPDEIKNNSVFRFDREKQILQRV